MSKKRSSRWILYGSSGILIAGWWALAFLTPAHTPSETPSSIKTPPISSRAQTTLSSLSPLQREELQQALSGDIALITTLIEQWDRDAQNLITKKTKGIKRLTSVELEEVKQLEQYLLHSTPEELVQLRKAYRIHRVLDDTGHAIDLSSPPERFLPQTHVATSFLLALTEPKHIVAIPEECRSLPQLYPKSILDQISLDANRNQSEKIFNAKPDIAFIANYSHPATVETLCNQGIEFFTFNKTGNVPDIISGLTRMGHIVNRPLRAKLLSLFVKAAMTTIDNRVALLKHISATWPRRLLYLESYTHYSTPTTRTITGHLLRRLKLDQLIAQRGKNAPSNQWNVPITLEQIVDINPDCMIIASPKAKGASMIQRLKREPALAHTQAIRNRHIYSVDESVQTSPSQYVVLAYFDLYRTLCAAVGAGEGLEY